MPRGGPGAGRKRGIRENSAERGPKKCRASVTGCMTEALAQPIRRGVGVAELSNLYFGYRATTTRTLERGEATWLTKIANCRRHYWKYQTMNGLMAVNNPKAATATHIAASMPSLMDVTCGERPDAVAPQHLHVHSGTDVCSERDGRPPRGQRV